MNTAIDIIEQLLIENENLRAELEEVQMDLDFANETVEMYEAEEDRELDDLLGQTLDEMIRENSAEIS